MSALDTNSTTAPTVLAQPRPCRPYEVALMLSIINRAAEAYRGIIPNDCFHDPYMSHAELDREMAAGVVFSGQEADGVLVGVMGIQAVADVDLIRHAYVEPAFQGRGIGGTLLGHLRSKCDRRILVGTWAAASWAIGFYQRHGFELVSEIRKDELLRRYWTVSDRQIETSVVLEAVGIDA